VTTSDSRSPFYPIVRRQSEGVALGYVAGRLLEALLVVVGAISLLTVLTLGQGARAGNASAASLMPLGKSLVAIRWSHCIASAS
jgi:hypothetical protein